MTQTLKRYAGRVALLAGGVLSSGVAAHAQEIPENLSVTRTLTFANTAIGAVWTQAEGYIELLVAVMFVMIVVGVVFGLFRMLKGRIAGSGR